MAKQADYVTSISRSVAKFLINARVARLATADRSGRPHVVPICYAYDGKIFYTAIDQKPKRVGAEGLKRVRNILENRDVSLVVDEYHEDWSSLKYVLVRGSATLLRRGSEHRKAIARLTQKYPQYRKIRLQELHAPVIKIEPRKILPWGKFEP